MGFPICGLHDSNICSVLFLFIILIHSVSTLSLIISLVCASLSVCVHIICSSFLSFYLVLVSCFASASAIQFLVVVEVSGNSVNNNNNGSSGDDDGNCGWFILYVISLVAQNLYLWERSSLADSLTLSLTSNKRNSTVAKWDRPPQV